MAEFGLTAQGFKRKTYPDILESMQARARAFFGEDINLSDRSPLGLFIQTVAWEQSRLWEEAEKVYYAGYVDDAEGTQLDGVTKYAAISRKAAQRARGTLNIKGNSGATVPAGFRVETKDGVAFRTVQNTVIGDTGDIVAKIEAIEPGQQGNVPAMTITKIINPVAGVESVFNGFPTEGGADTESDPEYRERYYRSLSSGGSSTSAAVEAALLDMLAVKDAFVEENDAMEAVNGLPPKCIAPYVFGGDDAEVAKAILTAKAGGIQSFGATVMQVEDSRGYVHAIGFTRPAQKDIFARLQLTRGTEYPSDGDARVITAVIKYIGGMDADGVEYRGLGLGQSVIQSKVIATVGAIPGVVDIEVELSSDGINYSQSNIAISKVEIAITEPDKVVIA